VEEWADEVGVLDRLAGQVVVEPGRNALNYASAFSLVAIRPCVAGAVTGCRCGTRRAFTAPVRWIGP
jgi:hypothetical protein